MTYSFRRRSMTKTLGSMIINSEWLKDLRAIGIGLVIGAILALSFEKAPQIGGVIMIIDGLFLMSLDKWGNDDD